MGANWGIRTAGSGFKATGGRRAYNNRRQFAAAYRQARLVRMMDGTSQAECARQLGVSAATISRDMAKLNANWWDRIGLMMKFGAMLDAETG